MLLPTLARHAVFAGSEEADLRGRRAFRGTSVINVGSVDFSPYIRLLLTQINGARLADQLAVITDGDPPLPSGRAEHVPDPAPDSDEAPRSLSADDDEADDQITVYNRASELRALGKSTPPGPAVTPETTAAPQAGNTGRRQPAPPPARRVRCARAQRTNGRQSSEVN